MINKGMFNKGKYWIFGKNKGVSVSNFEEPKGRNKSIQYWISSNWSDSDHFVDIIIVPGAKNVLTKGVEYWMFLM